MLGREIGGRTVDTTLELAEVILGEAKVAIVPGEAFGSPGYMRLSFALGDEDLVDGVTRAAGAPRLMARILVTEEIADSGLEELRAAGHDVDRPARA